VESKSDIANADDYLYHTVLGVEIFIEKGQWQNKDEEIAKLRNVIEDKKKYISMLDQKLTDGEFLKRAPEFIVRQEQDKKSLAKKELAGLEEKMKAL